MREYLVNLLAHASRICMYVDVKLAAITHRIFPYAAIQSLAIAAWASAKSILPAHT